MIKYLALATIALTTTFTYAATVTSVPLEKAPFDSKKPIYIDESGGHGCPDGADLFVRALPPAPAKDAKKDAPVPQGDFESFYFAKSANPAQPAIIVSRPGIQEYVPVCLKVSK